MAKNSGQVTIKAECGCSTNCCHRNWKQLLRMSLYALALQFLFTGTTLSLHWRPEPAPAWQGHCAQSMFHAQVFWQELNSCEHSTQWTHVRWTGTLSESQAVLHITAELSQISLQSCCKISYGKPSHKIEWCYKSRKLNLKRNVHMSMMIANSWSYDTSKIERTTELVVI